MTRCPAPPALENIRLRIAVLRNGVRGWVCKDPSSGFHRPVFMVTEDVNRAELVSPRNVCAVIQVMQHSHSVWCMEIEAVCMGGDAGEGCTGRG